MDLSKFASESIVHEYPPGYSAADDLDGDGLIDPVEAIIKINDKRQEIQEIVENRIKREYLSKFKKEVDFHHKIAYKYERAFRLGKKNPEKQQELDLDIIDFLSEFSDYIQHDPMVLFYCMFFCIFYDNSFLVEFLRHLIDKLRIKDNEKRKKFDLVLDYIDVNGLERLRTVGESINTTVYHLVFYQAINDNLRVVYSKILKKLNQILLRNKDAELLLNTRDYELIQVCFRKRPTKVAVADMFTIGNPICYSYKQYNPAFFEEVLLDSSSKIENRVGKNFRERFLITSEAIYQVL